jgi:cellulose synthase operon protein YhjQ
MVEFARRFKTQNGVQMASRSTDIDGQSTVDSTPEDVAVLYSWANLQGAKYRDYSASRREYRAQVRYHAAKALLDRELRAHAEAEAAAAKTERTSVAPGAIGDLADGGHGELLETLPSRHSEEAARRAAAERVEAARRAEAAARAAVAALREEREVAEAHSSARRQALIYEESELRRRQLAGPQPHSPFGAGHQTANAGPGDLRSDAPANLQPFLFSGWQDLPGRSLADSITGYDQARPMQDEFGDGTEPPEEVASTRSGAEEEQTAPAWLFSAQSPSRPPVLQAISQNFKGDAAGGDTLQDSRERVAARWFALKGVFDHARPELPARHPIRPGDAQKPLLAVFSLAGGVGKTSLVATLGRALSAQGEKVVLTDTTSHGLLPIYFGSDDVLPGVVRALPPAAGSADPPVSLVRHDFAARGDDERQREVLTDEILRNGQGNHRLLLDICTGSHWLIRRLVDSHPIVLVPMAPDMNSVIGLQVAERLFRGMVDLEGRSLLPFYVLNQFDATLPLHLDVREVFRRQLGDRLLRTAIRRSPAVSEALAEGMTVLDYAADSPVSQDYRDVATWLRSVSPPATEEFRWIRWGDR